MTSCKILAVLGLALAGPFSIAQEIVTPGNSKMPHQPPSWFVRLASSTPGDYHEMSFYLPDERPTIYGKPTAGTGIKYFCGLDKNEKGVLTWRFCDM